MRPGFEIRILDVSHKFVDDTKTTTELILIDHFGHETVVSYVHSDDTKEQVLTQKEEYEKLLLGVIKDNIKWVEEWESNNFEVTRLNFNSDKIMTYNKARVSGEKYDKKFIKPLYRPNAEEMKDLNELTQRKEGFEALGY
jgi:tRNA G10  N-methylase Trm11